MKKYVSQNKQSGSVLLEALISVLIFSMGILALVGLQGAMVKNSSDAKYRSDASFIAQERLGRMWTDPTNVADYVENETPVALLPNGKRTVTVGPRRFATVTVTWEAPGMDPHQYVTSAYISAAN
ncbi:MAG: type IV pilus modification protein PilV [Methylophilaceae bacterium 17-43-7]|jgi:type IV pilus assembly protein PilV|nr:MAG: type IV pilus modification protein PilV [Methylophilales bacterium 28-44-11]OYZ08642.1 MAG: type IV pilus modification protein PilV [Methylophilales bacterium 16-45-7]OYZ70507.1 MAG: type IV pilus modification protein PilV [Methylophilaceae bacterium 17-43-7]